MIIKLGKLPPGTQIKLNHSGSYRFTLKNRDKANMQGVLTVKEHDANYTLVADEKGAIVPLAPSLRIHCTV